MGRFKKIKNSLEKEKNKLLEKMDKRKEEKERKKREQWKKNKRTLMILGPFMIALFIFIGIMSILEENEKTETTSQTEKNVVTQEPEKTNKTIEEIEEKETSEKVTTEKKKEEKVAAQSAEEKEDAKIKSIYNDAVGKFAYDIFKDLDKLGVEVEFIHETTKQDFTTAIQFESDPEDETTYIPWEITDLNSLHSSQKQASFYINTKENMDAEKNKLENKEILENKLSPTYAWGAVDLYGKDEFPYGFKLKISKMIAEEAVDENTWFLKAPCHVKNSSGIWDKNVICEAKVSGTSEEPSVISFNAYNP